MYSRALLDVNFSRIHDHVVMATNGSNRELKS